MTHPYESHKESTAGKSRAKELTKGYKKGGAVHSDEKQDKALIKKMVKKDDLKVEGRASGGRLDQFARGGKTGGKGKGKGKKKSGNHVNIAIVAPQKDKGDAPAALGALPPPGGGLPPGMPPMGPPPGGPPMPPPGAGGPPGMPPGMMNKGGRAYKNGGKVPMKAGAESGQGRKEKIKAYGLKPIKG